MNRQTSLWIPLALLVWLGSAWGVGLAQTTAEQGFLIVTSPTAEVKAGAKVVAEVRRDQRLPFTKRSGDWYLVEIRQNGTASQGWIHRDHVAVETTAQQTVRPPSEGNASWLKKQVMMTRRRPKLLKLNEATGQTEVVGEVHEADARVDKIQGDWLWIRTPNQEGWITRDDAVLMEDALEYFTRRIEQNANDSFAYNAQGIVWKNHREFDKALADLTEAIRLKPDSAVIHNRGVLWHGKKELAKALADFDEAIRLDPNSYLAYYHRGELYSEQKENDKAIADFTEAIRILPGYAAAHASRGWVWLAKKEYDRAFSDFDDAIRFDPKLVGPYRGRAQVYSSRKEYDKAIKDYSEAIRLNPNFTLAYVNRAVAWRMKGDFDHALADASEAVRLDPRSFAAYFQRANTYRGMKRYDLAIANYDKAIRLNPKSAEAFYYRGVAYQHNGETAKAEEDFAQAKKLGYKLPQEVGGHGT